MRIAIISDIHGDRLALARVIADMETRVPVDEVLVGGDIAQGGAHPAEVVDEIRSRGWPAVRGNADDLLVRIGGGMPAVDALRFGEAAHGPASPEAIGRAERMAQALDAEQIDYLARLPIALRRALPGGDLVLVHATPWSTEDVVLPDVEEETAARMVSQADARLVLYGHIHTPYIRRVGEAWLGSVGSVSGSNDADPRPAYTVVEAGPERVTIEFHRVDWPSEDRYRDYYEAQVDRSFVRAEPGPLPVRSRAREPLLLWQH